MNILKIDYKDFWASWNPIDNYFYHLLSTKYKVIIDSNNPQITFCSIFGDAHKNVNKRKSRKILFTGESRPFDASHYDITLSFGKTIDKNIQLPLWVLYIDWFQKPYMNSNPGYFVDIQNINAKNAATKNKFCNFIFNNNSGLRTRFFESLNTVCKVDSYGTLCNNMGILGGNEKQKLDIMFDYKFSICFENTKQDYYITEKILHGFASHSIPIYWGSNNVFEFFNKDAFIWVNDEDDVQHKIDLIMHLNRNNEDYNNMYKKNVFIDGVIDSFMPDKVLRKLGL